MRRDASRTSCCTTRRRQRRRWVLQTTAAPAAAHTRCPFLSTHTTHVQVRQEELERHDGAPSGKYTVGLGQQGLSFVGDREDVVSLALTALRRLLDRHGVSPLEVGRLEVGTESSVDSSKSIKSYLMTVLEEGGNTDVEVGPRLPTVCGCLGGGGEQAGWPAGWLARSLARLTAAVACQECRHCRSTRHRALQHTQRLPRGCPPSPHPACLPHAGR